ncbi:hypothetical protein F5Y02DRAFT_418484 [Annulohypoxylon stygium]|nr:hypothetical protein F5Y02DRAFT_418484 [Annulohypoxylon stygium]
MSPSWVAKVKTFFKKKRAQLRNYLHKDATMSKPEKYKSPAEKGVKVPNEDMRGAYSPYTIPYNSKGAQRSDNGEWVQSRTLLMPITPFQTPSHAAPPLYIDKKADEATATQGSKRGDGQEPGKQPERFHKMYPGIYTRQGPNKKM